MALIPTQLIPINLEKNWARNFLSSTGATQVKRPSDVLIQMLKGIEDQTIIKDAYINNSWDFEIDCPFEKNQSATIDGAMCSYLLSSYYTEYKKNGTAGRVVLKVQANPTTYHQCEFYNLTKFTVDGTTTTDITTDNDVIHASVLWQNMLVKNMRKSGMAAMHPLSRVAASEENLRAMAEYINDGGIYRKYPALQGNIETVVKLYNTACTRKSHQFYGDTMYYIPELAAATLITNVMSTQKASPGLISITNSSLKKMARATGGMDNEMILSLMEFTVGGSGSSTAEEIFSAFKAQKQRLMYVPTQSAPQGIRGYSLPAQATPAKSDFQQGAVQKKQK